MILHGLRQTRYNHHDDFHKPHHHPHKPGQESIETKKTGRGREIKIVRRVLDVNEAMAAQNRKRFSEKGIFVLNVMSSPGSGKTTTLVKTLNAIKDDIKSAVIVGDICTTNDADRLSETGVPVVQVNTDEFGGDCHLTALVIENAFSSLDTDDIDLLIVENIGNLVCPAEFDIGEDARAVILSVTEGEDKPLKYPLMFRESDIALLNKIDLLPYLDFDMDEARKSILTIHPDMPIFEISSKTEEGMAKWISWLKESIQKKKALMARQ
ncbi:MAG: hydrogenase nickel incorporation protein HypB [Proteobacteria bacterium]|nr:hydrogenase nickel incorporation protein HypB [Pseudomonadota bacterium]